MNKIRHTVSHAFTRWGHFDDIPKHEVHVSVHIKYFIPFIHYSKRFALGKEVGILASWNLMFINTCGSKTKIKNGGF